MYINLLIKIKNAETAGKKMLKIEFSKMNKAVADVLARNGFIGAAEIKGKPSKRYIFVNLKSNRQIEGLKLISKPSVRRYASYKDMKKVKGGHGILVVSTSKGIMTGLEARTEKVGGELLFELW